MKVIVDTADDILYKSFYVYGLEELVGKNQVKFSSKPFSGLSWESRNTKSIRFITQEEGKTRHFVIACDDSYRINEELYNWGDVYGSVNANFGKTPERFHGKLIPLCPSFGVRLWDWPQTLYHAFCNLSSSEASVKKFLGKYKRQMSRRPYSEYIKPSMVDSINGYYVFFLSTLWYSDEWNRNDIGVNARRANFIRACRDLEDVVFEGGLVSQGKDRSSESLFGDCLSAGVSMQDWMEMTKRSVLVFNTPAFWDCHGWKLGEYLAMGKCMVSTRLSNDLPAPLEHGKNIHFVENDRESMKDAIRYIIHHSEYRMKLEQGARDYWEQYGSPMASLKLLGVK